jgi:long-chain fatty acid transport protein
MPVRKFFLVFLVFMLLAFSRRADAAGFGIYEWSARGNALGGAMVARADDPSAVAFNPAGMVQLEGTQMMFGFTAISPTADVTGYELPAYLMADPFATTVSSTFFPPHFYYTRQVNENQWFGIGLFTRFGLGTEFDPDWFGRYNSYKGEIASVSVNPSWAWKVNDKFSLGVGIEGMYFAIDLRKRIPPISAYGLPENDSQLDGDSFGWGWNLGLLFKPVEDVRFGLTYRSTIEQEVKGDIKFGNPVPGLFPNTGAGGRITLPDLLSAGVFWQASPKLSLEVDAVLTRWSAYDNLTITYDDPVGGHDSTTYPKNWNDTWRYQIGIEYAINEALDLRVGYIIDPSPIPDSTVDYLAPTNDRKLYSIGLGYRKGDWTYDFSYTYLDIKPREIEGRLADFIYDSYQNNADAHLFGISLSRKF